MLSPWVSATKPPLLRYRCEGWSLIDDVKEQIPALENQRIRTNPSKSALDCTHGEAIKEGEDFFGKTVILAARIASQAAGGEILVNPSRRAADLGWASRSSWR